MRHPEQLVAHHLSVFCLEIAKESQIEQKKAGHSRPWKIH